MQILVMLVLMLPMVASASGNPLGGGLFTILLDPVGLLLLVLGILVIGFVLIRSLREDDD